MLYCKLLSWTCIFITVLLTSFHAMHACHSQVLRVVLPAMQYITLFIIGCYNLIVVNIKNIHVVNIMHKESDKHVLMSKLQLDAALTQSCMCMWYTMDITQYPCYFNITTTLLSLVCDFKP